MAHKDLTAIASAIAALEEVAAGEYWWFSKGIWKPDEPLFAAAVISASRPDDEPLAIAEGNDIASVIHDVASQIRTKGAN